MKSFRYLAAMCAIFAALPAHAQISTFKHIVVIVQENRTPDNLFYELCNQPPASCSSGSQLNKYDIQYPGNWNNLGILVTPQAVDLGIRWDIEHHHNNDWVSMCDQVGTACQMDGAANEVCKPVHAPCPGSNGPNYPPEFNYVQRDTAGVDVLGPYITLALTYGWANLMFQSNQGPSFPAHQFIYGATSAPLVNSNENDDNAGIYAAENKGGCLAHGNVSTIVQGVENGTSVFPCFTHQTLGTLIFGSPMPWRYYTPNTANDPNLWTAPEAILSECGGSNEHGHYTTCLGPEFETGSNVVPDPRQVLVDIQNCHLQNLNWVIPNGTYSDHAGITGDLGPVWVATIINTIGTSKCQEGGMTYWQNTAIIVTWDDWGGWYDHEPPRLNLTQGYQLGFRVPLLVVSAYGVNNTGTTPRTCQPYIDYQDVLDFGSIDDFIEGNFYGGWSPSHEGKLGFADARALQRGNPSSDLTNFFDLTQPACTFVPIQTPSGYDANFFINDSSTVLPPDDD